MSERHNNTLKIIKNINFFNFDQLSLYTFYIGILFLPSALPISALFLLTSIVFIIKNNIKKNLIVDNYDYCLIFSISLILLSNLRYLLIDLSQFSELKFTDSLTDLFNWIPGILCYWSFKNFINTENKKRNFINIAVCGSLPVIASCILHFWLKLYGPFYAFNGLIVWFLKAPIGNGPLLYASGLFSNPNYTAFWLSAIWPFSILLLRQKKNKLIFLIVFLLITYFSFKTGSRTIYLSFITSTILLFGIKKFFYPVILFVSLLLSINFSNFFNFQFRSITQYINPINLLEKLQNIDLNIFTSTRLYIYSQAVKYLSISPILGLGASSFPSVFVPLNYGINTEEIIVQHTHSMLLEIAFNYGFIVLILLLFFLINIFFNSVKIVFTIKEFNTSINKTWIASAFTIILFNTFDIVYYDGKFSIFSWILISGLKGIIDENKLKKSIS